MRVVLNAYPCVDTFFAVGGLLLGYLTFKELDRTGGRLNLLVFYLHRYIRSGQWAGENGELVMLGQGRASNSIPAQPATAISKECTLFYYDCFHV